MATDVDIWVLAEHRASELHEVSLELLGEARRLANELGGQPCAVLLGSRDESLVARLAHYGAARVYTLDHPLLARYTTDGYATALSELLRQHSPKLLLIGATPNGNDLAPRLAACLGAPLVTGCVMIKPDLSG